jgi:hypothetical protein
MDYSGFGAPVEDRYFEDYLPGSVHFVRRLPFGSFGIRLSANAKSHPASTPTTESRAADAVPGLS